jgi:hypothetical protein
MSFKFSNTTPPAPGGMALVTFQADGLGNVSAAYAAATSSNTSLDVTQALHGFTVNDAIYFTGSAWAKAKANAIGTLGLGIVAVVTDANNFTVFFSGYVSTLSGFTGGQYYFVSDATAGLLTSTQPTATTSFSNPLFFAITATTGVVLPFRPSELGIDNATTIISKTVNYTAVAGDFILCNTSGGGFTITLPLSAVNTGLPITVKKVSTDANILVVAPSGADTIDTSSTVNIVVPGTALSMVADGGTVWEID